MLTEKRHEQILKLLEERGSITVAEAKEILGTSESTIRRDITVLDREGKLVKVFGGAVSSVRNEVSAYEYTVAQKQDLNSEEKKRIAKYAASLIEPEDFVYLDAGTTTAYMLDYIGQKNITFVTNAVAHAQRLVDEKESFADRRGTEGVHGSGGGQPGHTDVAGVSFHQRLFRLQRGGKKKRVYHAGRQRSDGEADGDGAMREQLCALRRIQVRACKLRDFCPFLRNNFSYG